MNANHPSGGLPPIAPAELEKYSSAATLSDMEIFVFPELLFSLVLANIMSPRLWAWRDHEWFAGLSRMTPHRRIQRLKQFIIDRYEFNLDLDTWGLTTKERELARFSPWLDEATISRSNALFGYEGDKYYFARDIRRHFGLDKYTSNVIPYWKTETVEAMDAFRHKEGFSRGAGECVSLSTLYAAALFVVCRIPLADIFLMATPLHSQNFVLVSDGVLTNNRRIVTRAMWFNGTEQSAKAQRALRHEQVTVVSHHTGHVHCVYPEATIDPSAYARFAGMLRTYLSTEVTMEILANFLRDASDLQKCFQIRHEFHGRPLYIPAERVFAYEHASSYKISDATRSKLLSEIDEDEFFAEPLGGRMMLNKFDDFFRKGGIDLSNEADRQRLATELDCQCGRAGDVIQRLAGFARLEPRLPDQGNPKRFETGSAIQLSAEMTREEVVSRLESIRSSHPVADLAFYAARDLSRTRWEPFLKAALERNPVSTGGCANWSDDALLARLDALPGESIYDATRVAQPDEVWNYGRGDGLEKAVCLANVWKARRPHDAVAIACDGARATVRAGALTAEWPSSKGLGLDIRL
jgi:hypothetical protein